MGSLLARLFLKSNDPLCNLFTGRKENGDWGQAPRKSLEPRLLNLREMPYLI